MILFEVSNLNLTYRAYYSDEINIYKLLQNKLIENKFNGFYVVS